MNSCGSDKFARGGRENRTYMCIDLKSFYASVECAERGLDPFTTNLVVADPERTDKTICLAVSPAMKKLGVPGRCRVFEIPKGINYIKARPRMQLYIDYSADIYEIYLRYVDKSDIHVYSIDEVFMDVTDYLGLYGMSPRQLAQTIMDEIVKEKKISAACGIGTNLYLAKVALDITAKHSANHIGILDENDYRDTLWEHRPLTDFWRIGKGISERLAKYGIYTMKQIAQADPKMLYKVFGVDAELIIDHAWGRETVTMSDIKAYKPKAHSMSSGQVLAEDYTYDKAKLVMREMTDGLCLELASKGLVTDSVHLYVGYSKREGLPSARGTIGLPFATASPKLIGEYTGRLFERIVSRHAMVKRLTLTFNNTVSDGCFQLNMFTESRETEEEKQMMTAVADIKQKYGKNSIFKAMDLEEGATAIERNGQIGGHRA